MPDIRLKDNVALSSPVDADILFSANSASSPAFIESKTTFGELAKYSAAKISTSQTLTISGGNIAWDLSLGENAAVSMTSDATLVFPTHVTAGREFSLTATQDSTGSRTLTLPAGVSLSSGAPAINPVAGSSTILTFQAIDSSTAILVRTVSSQANWRNFTGVNLTLSGLANIAASSNGGIVMETIPGTTNVFVAVCNSSTDIKVFILAFDALGNCTNLTTTAQMATLITSTTLTNQCYPQICVMPDGLHAIVSYAATRGGVYCQNLTPVAISGLTATAGTEMQVRSTEALASSNGTGGSVCALDNSNFSLVFRTATANILYAYQMSVSYPTITTGSAPLTVETGNGSTNFCVQGARSSSTTRLLFLSSVTATNNFCYAVVLTFNGIGNIPTMGALFQVGTGALASLPRAMRVTGLPGQSTTKFIATVVGTFVAAQVINDASGVLSGAGAFFTYTANTSSFAGPVFVPDANHIFIYVTAATSNNGFVILNISPAYAITAQNSWFGINLTNTLSIGGSFIPVNGGKQGFVAFSNGTLFSTLTFRP